MYTKDHLSPPSSAATRLSDSDMSEFDIEDMSSSVAGEHYYLWLTAFILAGLLNRPISCLGASTLPYLVLLLSSIVIGCRPSDSGIELSVCTVVHWGGPPPDSAFMAT